MKLEGIVRITAITICIVFSISEWSYLQQIQFEYAVVAEPTTATTVQFDEKDVIIQPRESMQKKYHLDRDEYIAPMSTLRGDDSRREKYNATLAWRDLPGVNATKTNIDQELDISSSTGERLKCFLSEGYIEKGSTDVHQMCVCTNCCYYQDGIYVFDQSDNKDYNIKEIFPGVGTHRKSFKIHHSSDTTDWKDAMWIDTPTHFLTHFYEKTMHPLFIQYILANSLNEWNLNVLMCYRCSYSCLLLILLLLPLVSYIITIKLNFAMSVFNLSI